MNFLTSDTAYSLYPHATFNLRVALSFAGLSQSDQDALGKYAERGWSFVSHRFPLNMRDSHQWWYLGRRRRPTDRYAWRIPLVEQSKEGMPPMRLFPTTQELPWDPVVPNAWQLKWTTDDNGERVMPTYFIVKSIACRYSYILADYVRIQKSREFLEDQGELERSKVAHLPDDSSKALVWKWYAWKALPPPYFYLTTHRWDRCVPDLFSGQQSSASLPY
jgi:hypothetical protein